MAAPRQVIVHPGFHKTGTTTVQRGLRQNRGGLRDHLRFILRPGMLSVCEAARAYSESRSQLDLALFQYELAQLAEGWDMNDSRPILLCSEDLSGHMPGRRGLTEFDATPKLMRTMANTLTTILPGCQVQFYFSTRAAAPWLTSCYAQHLKASRIVLDADDYATSYQNSANLDAIVDAVATAVAPHPVQRCALEDSQNLPLGPLDPLLDLIELPADVRAAIIPQPQTNIARTQSTLDQLLTLNRSNLDTAALHAAKKDLMRGAP